MEVRSIPGEPRPGAARSLRDGLPPRLGGCREPQRPSSRRRRRSPGPRGPGCRRSPRRGYARRVGPQGRRAPSVAPLQPGRGGLLRLRRPAPGPGREVRRPGRDADDAEVPQTGVKARGDGMLTQAPPNTGAGWYTHGDRRVAGRARLDQQHVPQERRPVRHHPHRGVRPRRAAGGVDRPGRRAGWPQGRPDGVGRRAQRLDPGPDDRLPDLLLRSGRGHELHRPDRRRALRRRAVHRLVRAAVRPPRRVSPDSAPFPAAAPTPATGWTDVPSRTARRRRCGCGCSTRDGRQVRPQRLHLRQPQRRRARTTTGCCSPRRRTAPTRSATCRGRVGRRQGDDRRRRAGRQDRRHAGQGRDALARPLPRPAVPHLGDPRERELADLAGRAGLHRVRRVPRRRVPDLHRRRLRDPRGRRRPARRPTSSRASTGRPATGRCWSTSPRPTSPTCCWSACRPPTSSSTSSSAWSASGCPTVQPTRRTTTWTSTASRTDASKQRSGVHPRGLPGVRPDAAPRALAGRQGPDHVRRLRPRLRAAVPGDRRQPAAGRAGPAVATADLELPHRPPARRSARRRPAGPAARCRSTSTSRGATRPEAASSRSQRPTRRRPSRRSRRRSSA